MDKNSMIEEWRQVVGREGRYEVSNLGRVRTVHGRILGQWANDQGYMLARVEHPRRCLRVHRAVAEAFVKNPEGKPFVNHLDCIRSSNAATNLEWCTQAENLRHAASLGRLQKAYWKGKRSPNASLADEQVRQMRQLYAAGNISWSLIGEIFGVSKRCAGRAIKGETYANVQ